MTFKTCGLFCEDCRYCHQWDDCFGGCYYDCKATKIECSDPIHHYFANDGKCEDRNKNNDCVYYKRKWWKLWRPKCLKNTHS